MAAVMDGMPGIVVGSVFGGIFVLTCLISAIKAVRDRRRIKRKIADRQKKRMEFNGDIEEKQVPVSEQTTNGVSNSRSSGPSMISGPSCYNNIVPTFSAKDGVDNLMFKHSHVDIKYTDDHDKQNPPRKSSRSSSAETVSNKNYLAPKRTLSEEVRRNERGKNVSHLSSECLAVKKTARRHSYEVAVAEHSWLPIEPPNFASSETIMNTYKYGGSAAPRIPTIGFENKAYDVDDYKNKRLVNKL